MVGGAAIAFAAPQLAAAEDPILLAAGDIAGCDSDGDEQTAALLDGQPGSIAALGDIAYETGSAVEFDTCYAPSWGRHRDRTFPTPGNHDYLTVGAAPYFEYFGARAGPIGLGYYSYDLGSWHIVSLNSNCTDVPCGPGSAQETWLRNDLAQSSALCTLAYWHHASFSSGITHGTSERMRTLLDLLHAHDVDLVLSGHEHNYERFAPQTPDRIASSSGLRAFVVGTGGREPSYPFADPPAPNSEVRMNGVRGVLKLTLHATGYDWEFVPVAGQTFTDTGTGACHGAPPPDTTAPTAPTGLTATSPSGSRVDLAWTAATDDVAVAGYRIFRDGAEIGTTSATTWSDAAVTPGTSYAYHVVAYDSALNVSPQSNIATVTTKTADRTLTFVPTADATIESAKPSTTFGGATTLQADASPVRSLVIKFNLTDVGAANVVSTKLRLHVTNPSNRGGDIRTAGVAWAEGTVNWQNAPAGGALVGSLLRVVQGTWYEVALPAGTVSGDGEIAFRIDSPSTDGVDYVSREGTPALVPQLVVRVTDPSVPDAEPPTAPDTVTATAAPNGSVDLAWSPSTDNVRVAGYRILRNGVEIASTSASVYTDTSTAPATTYTYRIVAYDTAGNTSPLSAPATVTTAAPPRMITVTPAADATIVSGSPTANFGTANTLEADASPVKSFLVKFNVAGVGTGIVTAARLRLHVTNASDRGGDVRATSGSWSETSVAWGTAPAGAALAVSLGAVALGSWQDAALAPGIVVGDGTVSLRVDSTSSDGAAYDAREAGATLAPQLVLTVADSSIPDTTPPTAPSGLTAVAASGRVDLAWTAATDDVRVAGYRILRNGVEIATTNETTYPDTAVAGSTTYSYQVVAYDPSNHVSPPSNTATVTTPAADRVLTFFPSADASVVFDTPTTNQGAARDLQADNSPLKSFLLKFTVSGIGTGRVTGAKLRLHVTNNSDRGGNFTMTGDTWLENTVTWSTAPVAGTSVGSLGVVGLGTWQELALTAGTVTGDGTLSLRVDSTSSDGVGYDSREAGPTLAPQLIVTVAG